jgi:hypothetical protein
MASGLRIFADHKSAVATALRERPKLRELHV